jgi:hypothetical protein
LLLNLRSFSDQELKIAYIDCQDTITSESLRFFNKSTGKSVHRALGKKTKFTKICSTLSDVTEVLFATQAELEENNLRLLLCFDHYEKLTDKIVNGEFSAFPSHLHNWIQRLSRTTIVLCGRKAPSEIMKFDWNNYIGNARTIVLGELSLKSSLDLAIQPMERTAIKFNLESKELENFIVRLGCYPYLIQTAFSELINILNYENRKEVNQADLDKVINNLFKSSNNFFETLWYTERTEEERKILTSIALGKSLPRASHEAINTLNRKGHLKVTEQGYIFKLPVFKEWILYRGIT